MDTNLTFGIEIECVLPPGLTFRDAAAKIVAAGVACHAETYTHAVTSDWKIVTDGSLNGNGAEFVSPILSGEAGLLQARKVADALVAMGAAVNSSCGLHVHVHAGANQPGGIENVKNVVALYATYEPEIDKLMPPSRRMSNNTYCQSMTLTPAAMERAMAAQSYEQLTNAADARGRYKKVNLTSIPKYGTVEFRQHSGTIDADKIENWVRFCVALVKAARNGKKPSGTRVVNKARAGSKTWTVGNMILRPEGVLGTEISEFMARASNTPPHVNNIAKRCGIELVKVREGRTFRYFARMGEALDGSLEGLMALIELPEQVRTFYRQRAASFMARTDGRIAA